MFNLGKDNVLEYQKAPLLLICTNTLGKMRKYLTIVDLLRHFASSVSAREPHQT